MHTKPVAMLAGATVGTDMWTKARGKAVFEVPTSDALAGMTWISIDTSEFAPALRRGDIVGGSKTSGAALHNQSGRECIVALTDGRLMLSYLIATPRKGYFDLRSMRAAAGTEDVRGVKVDWAAPISVILRGK